MMKTMPIFLRLLLAFLAVGALIGGPLIYFSFQFNKDSARLRTQQNVEQQIAIIKANFDQEFELGLQRTLKQITASEALALYLSSSFDERTVNAKLLETNFLKLQADYANYSGIYYADAEGRLISIVEDKKRIAPPDRVATTGQGAVGWARTPTGSHFERLFAQIKTKPSLLSAGNMEWFMPPRAITVEGPFMDERGRLSMLAGLSSLDLDNGAFGGAVVVRVDLDGFVKKLKSVTLFDAHPIWLFSRNGDTLLRPDASPLELSAKAFDDTPFADEVIFRARSDGLVAFRDLSVIPGAPFLRLAYGVPVSLLLKDFESALSFFLIVLLVSALAVFVLAYFVARHFSRPIIELANAASTLASGQQATRVVVKSSGELSLLVDSFNRMAENLQLANQNRANAFAVLRQTAAQMQSETGAASEVIVAAAGMPTGPNSIILQPGQEDANDLSAISALIRRLIDERDDNLRNYRTARDAADQANLTKGEFLAMISHEIRTPMNGILGTVQLLEHSPLDEAQSRDLTTIRNCGDALLELIDQILDFSKIEAGKLELELRDFDLRNEFNQIVALYRPVIADKGLHLDLTLADDLPIMVKGDSTRLRQILSNLISNAIKFTHQGHIRVEARSKTVADGRIMISGVVSDSGIGIPADRLDRLFKAFSQVDISTTRQFGGTGLGLAICAKLCEAMGGQISVDSVSGVGSSFRFEIFMAASQAVAKAVTTVDLDSSTLLPSLRILVAEDNLVNQKIAFAFLQKLGLQPDLAENGQEAIERARTTHYDAILMDMQMPIMDGIESTRAIRQFDLAHQPWIIAMTANAFDSDRERCIDAGMNDFISKPFRIEALRDKLMQIARTVA